MPVLGQNSIESHIDSNEEQSIKDQQNDVFSPNIDDKNAREAVSAEAKSLKFTADLEKIAIDQINQEE